MADAIKTFFDAWGTSDIGTQAAAIGSVLDASARYTDPRTPEALIGPKAVAAYISQFTQMAPGAVAAVIDSQTRGGVTRATVEFRMADGMTQLGQYFIETGDDGRLTRLVGFVGTGTGA